jgi:hypothetical protein
MINPLHRSSRFPGPPAITDKEAAVKKLQLFKSKVTGSVFNHFFQALVDGKVRPSCRHT